MLPDKHQNIILKEPDIKTFYITKENYQISALTANEVIFAGGTTTSNNTSFYLVENTQSFKSGFF
ncbi:MAG: hypothetical protein UIL36_06110, partial [Turicibacter sp.]|nr:hypothetical protein [Turicibacter sp.]